jgi:hypothetical protein
MRPSRLSPPHALIQLRLDGELAPVVRRLRVAMLRQADGARPVELPPEVDPARVSEAVEAVQHGHEETVRGRRLLSRALDARSEQLPKLSGLDWSLLDDFRKRVSMDCARLELILELMHSTPRLAPEDRALFEQTAESLLERMFNYLSSAGQLEDEESTGGERADVVERSLGQGIPLEEADAQVRSRWE